MLAKQNQLKEVSINKISDVKALIKSLSISVQVLTFWIDKKNLTDLEEILVLMLNSDIKYIGVFDCNKNDKTVFKEILNKYLDNNQ